MSTQHSTKPGAEQHHSAIAPPPARIMEMASAYHGSCVLFAACDAGVFSEVERQPGLTSDAFAAVARVSPRGARLLLDACVALRLLVKEGEGYHNTAEARTFLVPGGPHDLSKALRYNRDVYAAWGKLSDLVRTGRAVEDSEVHLGHDAARTRAFVMAMHGRALALGPAIVPHVDLAGCRTLLDVGGGPGTLAALLATANPELTCVVVDLPAVAAIARELLAQSGMAARVQAVDGDYHHARFPQGQDAVLFAGMLHQESPEAICDLLARAYAALQPGGRVIVLDMMTDATHTHPPFSALFAVNMALTTPNGWVFSDAELRGWLEGAGFADFDCRPLPAPLPHWLAQARKPALRA